MSKDKAVIDIGYKKRCPGKKGKCRMIKGKCYPIKKKEKIGDMTLLQNE